MTALRLPAGLDGERWCRHEVPYGDQYGIAAEQRRLLVVGKRDQRDQFVRDVQWWSRRA